jgi:hypothetical protein
MAPGPTARTGQGLVKVHDFIDPALGKANPYGVDDLATDTGWVSVGTDHDTAAFAVETIRRWWQSAATTAYSHATRLLITADGGGSNGYRTRLWKTALAALAAHTGLAITVCHLPPGTSKWNKIEHRLFSHISMNWRGRPLTSHDVIVQSIATRVLRRDQLGGLTHEYAAPGPRPGSTGCGCSGLGGVQLDRVPALLEIPDPTPNACTRSSTSRMDTPCT